MNNPQLQNARCGKRLHHTCEYIIFELHHSIPVLHKSRQLNGTPFVCSVSGRNKVRNKFSPFHRGISPFDVEPKGFKFMHCQLLIHSNCCTKCFSNVASIFLTCNAILHLVRLKPSKIRPSLERQIFRPASVVYLRIIFFVASSKAEAATKSQLMQSKVITASNVSQPKVCWLPIFKVFK